MHEHHDEGLILDLRNDPAATDAEIAARLDGCGHPAGAPSTRTSSIQSVPNVDRRPAATVG